MRPGKVSLVIIVVLICANLPGDEKLANSEAAPRVESFDQGPPAPPLPVLIPFRSLNKRLIVNEGESLIIGEISANCAPVYG
jgi:hypothetical protein